MSNVLEKFRDVYKIDKVLESLSMKGTDVIDRFSLEMTNILNSNIDVPVPKGKICDMRVLQIYDSNFQISNSLKDFFKDEIEILKLIPNLNRALYIFVSPNSVIPEHCDNDDQCFRIIYGVSVPSNNIEDISLLIEDSPINVGYKQVVGLSADVNHSGWNKTNEYWSVLTLCVKDKKLDELRKIY